jgi:hypothetical protein
MKRPHLVHFTAIATKEAITVKASITLRDDRVPYGGVSLNIAQEIARSIEKELPKPSFPIQAFRLLRSRRFQMKLVCLGEAQVELFKKTYESDSYGNFNIKIPHSFENEGIKGIQAYEVGTEPGLELLLGTFIPLQLKRPKKLIICDFDKTLVDTKYSTTKELYNSLTKPLEYFPTVPRSVAVLRSYIKKGFHPFILSASPHFYEEAIRDWLYQKKIFTAGIFLKDYRQVFSLFEMDLTPKDLKLQGLYKMNHLLDILLMTGIPDELVLMGDNFESDPLIYVTLAKLLSEDVDPWNLWNSVRRHRAFLMNNKQDSQLLNKFYQLTTMLGHSRESKDQVISIKIYIRKKLNEDVLEIPSEFKRQSQLIELYAGAAELPQEESAPGL